MSETPVSPLRQRMIEDMTVRKLGAATQRTYIRAVKTLSEFLGRSPASATAEDLRRFQVHQSEAGAQPPVMNNTVTALRFFFRVTLDRPEMARHLILVRQPRKLPNVLNEEEVVRLLENASGLKYRAALGVAYGAGLRVSEVANLKVSDIDSKRMLIRVEEGKGKKDRNAMRSAWAGIRHPSQQQTSACRRLALMSTRPRPLAVPAQPDTPGSTQEPSRRPGNQRRRSGQKGIEHRAWMVKAKALLRCRGKGK